MSSRRLGPAFFAAPTLDVARGLVGCTLVHGRCAGVIVECEAYTDDPASHYVTRRRQGRVMAETHGRIYIYRSYGVHHCLNFTTDQHGVGAVLLRALEPVQGLDLMRRRRGLDDPRALASGPGKLVEAMGISPRLDGRAVLDAFELLAPETPLSVDCGPRVGISRAKDLPWRFWARGSRFVSRRS